MGENADWKVNQNFDKQFLNAGCVIEMIVWNITKQSVSLCKLVKYLNAVGHVALPLSLLPNVIPFLVSFYVCGWREN